MKITLLVTFLVYALSMPSGFSQNLTVKGGEPARINWMGWEEALAKAKKEKRKIVLDVYTEWCKWCKQMENTTFRQPELAVFINENFYPVKLDAEQKEELEYRDKVYKFVRNGNMGYHELAAELLRGRLSFPALIFLDEDLNVIQSFVGYKTSLQLEQIATYFASDQYKTVPWSTFQKNYKSKIED